MDAVSTASASRLLKELDRMGLSKGEGLVSSGPSPVPHAVSRAFEQLMEQTDVPSPAVGSAETSQGMRTTALSPEEKGIVDSSPSDMPAGEVSRASPSVEAPLISPQELYHLQFQVAMLRHEVDTGFQVTQKTTQGLDSLLRNQS